MTCKRRGTFTLVQLREATLIARERNQAARERHRRDEAYMTTLEAERLGVLAQMAASEATGFPWVSKDRLDQVDADVGDYKVRGAGLVTGDLRVEPDDDDDRGLVLVCILVGPRRNLGARISWVVVGWLRAGEGKRWPVSKARGGRAHWVPQRSLKCLDTLPGIVHQERML